MPGFPPSQTKSRVLLLLFSLLHSKWNAKKACLPRFSSDVWKPGTIPCSPTAVSCCWLKTGRLTSLSVSTVPPVFRAQRFPVGPVDFATHCSVYRSGGSPSCPALCLALPGEELDSQCPLPHLPCGNESVENSLTHPDLLLSLVLEVCLFVESDLSSFQNPMLCGCFNTLAYKLFEKM